MALNLASNGTFNEARGILIVSKDKVFEALISSESPQAVAEAKVICDLPTYPNIRVRY